LSVADKTREALDALPALRWDGQAEQDVQTATGMMDIGQPLAPNLVPTVDERSLSDLSFP
jgi:hypothetical protein